MSRDVADFLACTVPSTWAGESYTAPNASRPIEETLYNARVPDPKHDSRTTRRVAEALRVEVEKELWETTRTSFEITASLRARGVEVTHRQVSAALCLLAGQGRAKRSMCGDRRRKARFLWRKREK